jgi:hypothetical protein
LQIRARFEALTPREQEVVGLVTAGLMNKQVAAELGVSLITTRKAGSGKPALWSARKLGCKPSAPKATPVPPLELGAGPGGAGGRDTPAPANKGARGAWSSAGVHAPPSQAQPRRRRLIGRRRALGNAPRHRP